MSLLVGSWRPPKAQRAAAARAAATAASGRRQVARLLPLPLVVNTA